MPAWIVTMVLFAISFSACDNKDLAYLNHDSIKVSLEFDWRDAPEAEPKGMVVYFYPTDRAEGYLRFSLPAKRRSEISIPQGKYRLLTYNNDIEFASGNEIDAWHTHHLFTRTASIMNPSLPGSEDSKDLPRPTGTEDEPVVVSPEEIWGCTSKEVEVSADNYGKVITLYPHSLVCRYTYEIRNVKNLSSAEKMNAALSGLSPTLTVHDESHADYAATVPAPALIAGENTIRGEFFTFGHNENLSAPHRFALYVTTKDGNNHFFGKDEETFDVTGQIHAAPDRHNVHFVIDGLQLPKSENEPGGWQLDAEDWNEKSETIIIK